MKKESNYYIGVDCSSKSIHCVSLNDSAKIAFIASFKTDKEGLDERMYMLYDDLIKFVEDNLYIFKHKVIVVVENSIYIQNVRATIGISQTVAASKLVFNKFGAAVFGIDNKSWKKDVLASGKAEKSLIKKFALTKWPDDLNETMDQDFFDAACIAYYGFSKFGK